MSSNWIRGKRCNVDNCKTHYFRLIDGQRICQFGHVYEGHVEYNDEDEEFSGAMTKRLKLPNASQASQSTLTAADGPGKSSNVRLYGDESKNLLIRCFQYAFKLQIRAFMKEFDLPETFETVCKSYWIDYLTLYLNENNKIVKPKGDGHENSRDTETTSYVLKSLPVFSHTIAIIYVACRHMQLPIFMDDILSAISTEAVPYIRAFSMLPTDLSLKLGANHKHQLEPESLPSKGDIYLVIMVFMGKLDFTPRFELNYEPFLLKIINDLVLPPRIYEATKKIVKQCKINLTYPKTKKSRRETNTLGANLLVNSFPEITICICAMIATKIYFKDPKLNKNKLNDEKSIISWKKWSKIITLLRKKQSDGKDFETTLKTISSSNAINNEILNWDDAATKKYIEWFVKSQADPDLLDDIKQPIPIRRLNNMFKLDENTTDINDNYDEIGDIKMAYNKLFKPLGEDEFKKEDIGVSTKQDCAKIQDIFVDYIASNFTVRPEKLIRRMRLLEGQILRPVTFPSDFD